jgi:hypothetical protein
MLYGASFTQKPFRIPNSTFPLSNNRQVEHADNQQSQTDDDIHVEKRLIYP